LEGIDVKGRGGLIVGPGSRHIQGTTYTLLQDAVPAPAPPWLKPARKAPAEVKEAFEAGPVPEGQRNDFLVWMAGHLRNLGLSREAIYRALQATNQERLRPPASDEKLQEIAEWIGGKEASRKGAAGRESGLVSLAEVEPRHVEWLWVGRIPLGMLTILDGDPGLANRR
jgi:hypothetical protein